MKANSCQVAQAYPNFLLLVKLDFGPIGQQGTAVRPRSPKARRVGNVDAMLRREAPVQSLLIDYARVVNRGTIPETQFWHRIAIQEWRDV